MLKMVMSCSAYKCPEKYVKNSPVTFHSFPKDPERRNIWIAALKINGFIPKPHSKICSNHFTHDSFDWEKFGGKWLKPTAVPSIFPHVPQDTEQGCSSTATPPLSPVSHPLHDSEDSNMSDDLMSSPDESAYQDLKENTPPPENCAHMEEYEDETTYLPSRVQRRLRVAKNIIKKQKKKIAMLQLKNHQLQKKIALLTEMIISLKKKDVNNPTD